MLYLILIFLLAGGIAGVAAELLDERYCNLKSSEMCISRTICQLDGYQNSLISPRSIHVVTSIPSSL